MLPLRLPRHVFIYCPGSPTEPLRGSYVYNLEMLLTMLNREATAVATRSAPMRWIRVTKRSGAGGEVCAGVETALGEKFMPIGKAENGLCGRIFICRPKSHTR